jgi:regulator of RNase E activity RraA
MHAKISTDALSVDTLGPPGFCIAPHAPSAATATIRALGEVPVAVVGDVMGRRGVMDGGIRPLAPAMRIAGPAVTVETRPGDNLMLHAALRVARPGDVLVVDGHGYAAAAVWGMLMTHTALAVGLGGLIVDGAVRDCEEIAASGFAVCARHICAAGPHKDGPGTVNRPVACGRVAVQSGDVVLADADGVAIVSPSDADAVLKGAQAKVAAEAARAREIREDGLLHQDWLVPTLRAKGVLGPEDDL